MYPLRVLHTPNDRCPQAKMDLRVAVCRQCTGRTPCTDHYTSDMPRACEESCSLFNALPDLLYVGQCVDPMVGSRSQTLGFYLNRLATEGCVIGFSPYAGVTKAQWVSLTPQVIGVLQNLLRD